jgi:DNA polymerase (family 10)
VVVPPGIQVDLRIIDDEHYPTLLHHFTGSKNHNVRLRTLALSKGMKVSEYGVFKVVDGEEVPMKVESEEDIYRLLGLDFVPPTKRED